MKNIKNLLILSLFIIFNAYPAQDNQKNTFRNEIKSKIYLLGKIKVLENKLRNAYEEIQNEQAKKFILSLIDNLTKVNFSDEEDLLNQLKKINHNIDQLKTSLNGGNELNLIEDIKIRINKINNFYEKHVDNEILNLTNLETFTHDIFKDLIIKQINKNQPYILARIKNNQKNNVKYFYFDAQELNNYIFNGYPVHPNNKWQIDANKNLQHNMLDERGMIPTLNIFTGDKLKSDNIDYFVINSLKDNEFKYLTSFEDLIEKEELQKYFYKNLKSLNRLRPVHTLEHEFEIDFSVISRNNKYIITAAHNIVKIWDIKTGTLLHTLNHNNNSVTSVTISDDSKYIATGSSTDNSQNNTAQIWDLETGELLHVLSGHKSFIYSVLISPNSKYVVTSSFDVTIKIWNLESGEMIHTLNPHELSDEYINQIIQRSPLIMIMMLTLSKYGKLKIFVTPDSKYLISGNVEGNDKHKIKKWDLQTGKLIREIHSIGEDVSNIILSPDNKYLIETSTYRGLVNDLKGKATITNLSDNLIELFKYIYRGHTTELSHNGPITSMSISPKSSRYIVTGSDDKTAKVWDLSVRMGKLLNTLDHNSAVNSVAISSDDKYIVTGSGDTVKIWERKTGKEIDSLDHDDKVTQVIISPNDDYLVTVSGNKAYIWD